MGALCVALYLTVNTGLLPAFLISSVSTQSDSLVGERSFVFFLYKSVHSLHRFPFKFGINNKLQFG